MSIVPLIVRHFPEGMYSRLVDLFVKLPIVLTPPTAKSLFAVVEKITSAPLAGTIPETQLVPVFQSVLVEVPIQRFGEIVTVTVKEFPEQLPEVGVTV